MPPSNGKVIVQVVDKHIQMCYLVLVLPEVCLAASKVLSTGAEVAALNWIISLDWNATFTVELFQC